MQYSSRVFQSQNIVNTPKDPGLYAWYYRPRKQKIIEANTRFREILRDSYKISTRVDFRYNRHVAISGTGYFDPDEEKTGLGDASQLLANLFSTDAFLGFCRPLYIGITLKQSLYTRVYEQHYKKFASYWLEESMVNTILNRNPEVSLKELIELTSEPDSFALNARFLGIPPQDLAVSVLPVKDADTATLEQLKSIEDLLQLLADPVCGKR